jgi:iron(III) transport system substrate-binding protein
MYGTSGTIGRVGRGGYRSRGLLALALAIVLALCVVAPAGAAADPTTSKPKKVNVAKAKSEGSVNFYTTMQLDKTQALAQAFQDKYGITVNVVRDAEANLRPRIDAELSTGNVQGDFYANADAQWDADTSKAGHLVPATGPNLYAKKYDRAANVLGDNGDYFKVAGTINGFGWNTDLYPKGIKTFQDLLKPELKGKIGVVVPAALSVVTFYQMIENAFGEKYLKKLAAQEPKKYSSVVPMAAAVTSGEILAAIEVTSQGPAQAAGAPIGFGLPGKPTGAWGTYYSGMIFKDAPHPNAAQLFANWIVSKEAQTILGEDAVAVLPGIKNTLGTMDDIYVPDPKETTPEAVNAFIARWNEIFGS